MVVVEELLVEKLMVELVVVLVVLLVIVFVIGLVCELVVVLKFFNGNFILGMVFGGFEYFIGKVGNKCWNLIVEVIGCSWDDVFVVIDEIISIFEVDVELLEKVVEELVEEFEGVEEVVVEVEVM